MSDKDQVITWLRDAYAMERGIEQVLENHAKDAKDVPEMQNRLNAHLEETRRQAERVEECLKSLGADTSTGKSVMGSIMGKMNGAMTGMYRDEIVKNTLAEYATEHFEIASYKSLIAGATRAGLPNVAAVCEEILREEESMAEWLAGRVEMLTHHYMDKARREEAA